MSYGNPEPLTGLMPESFDSFAFLSELRSALEDKGIELYWDNYNVIYTHKKTGIKIVDITNGIGPVGTILGMNSTFSVTAKDLEKLIEVPINDNQYAALISFASHIGIDNFSSSKVLTELNKGNYAAVPKLMQRWRTGKTGKNSKVSVRPDYVARRKYEGELFMTPDWIGYREYMDEHMPTPSNCNFEQARTRLKVAKRKAFEDNYPGMPNPF